MLNRRRSLRRRGRGGAHPRFLGEITRPRTGVVVLAAGVRIKAKSRTGEESSMPTNPPKNMTRITPYLYYEDVANALDWLVSTE